jgi:hypothetical protein
MVQEFWCHGPSLVTIAGRAARFTSGKGGVVTWAGHMGDRFADEIV